MALQSGEKLEFVLVVNAVGRAPDIGELSLDNAGIRTVKSGIEVDCSMRTSEPHIFAVGDCAATLKLARVADMEAKIAVGAITAMEEGGDVPQIDYTAAQTVLFTYPQLGMVGKTENTLKKEGRKYWKSYESAYPVDRTLRML